MITLQTRFTEAFNRGIRELAGPVTGSALPISVAGRLRFVSDETSSGSRAQAASDPTA